MAGKEKAPYVFKAGDMVWFDLNPGGNDGDYRMGVIVKTELDGGVFRGHCDIWLGDCGHSVDEEGHVQFSRMTLQLPTDRLTLVEKPIGRGEEDFLENE